MKKFEEFKAKCSGAIDLAHAGDFTIVTFSRSLAENKSLAVDLDGSVVDKNSCVKRHAIMDDLTSNHPQVPDSLFKDIYEALTSEQLENLETFVIIAEPEEPTVHIFINNGVTDLDYTTRTTQNANTLDLTDY